MKASELIKTIRKDGENIKVTVKEEPHNAQSAVKHYLKKHQNKLLVVFLLGVVFFTSDYSEKYIPEWFFVMLISGGISAIVTWPYAKKIANFFIEDNRKPILEIDPKNMNDVSLYKVPEKKTSDINVVQGEMQDIQTDMGRGYEVQELEIDEEGPTTTINVIGTWAGSKSGLELKRDYKAIKNMFDTLEPLAMKGFEYDMVWPKLVNDLSERITNMLVMQFQDVNFKGREIQDHIREMVSHSKPVTLDEETDKGDIEKTLEELQKEKKGNEQMAEKLDELADMQVGENNAD